MVKIAIMLLSSPKYFIYIEIEISAIMICGSENGIFFPYMGR